MSLKAAWHVTAWILVGASACNLSGGGSLDATGGTGGTGNSGTTGGADGEGGAAHAGEGGSGADAGSSGMNEAVPECADREPGATVCRGRERFECGAGGTERLNVELCAGECQDGACTGCTPNARRCSGLLPQVCSSEGTWGDDGAECESACDAATGTCVGQCDPGATRCSGNGVQTCNDEGVWGATVPCDAQVPQCINGTCSEPPSCQALASTCGAGGDESCCTSLLVPGGTFARTGTASDPATLSSYRLDKYEVTVSRFRRFVDAVVDGFRPPAGAGKHSHLHEGNGLANSGASDGYEPGWDADWNEHLPGDKADWDAPSKLSCNPGASTWTPSAGANEQRPISCVNWYEAYAFCIWDGGFLPSEAEWLYVAVGGSEQRTYPWGSTAPGANALLAAYNCYFGPAGTCSDASYIAPVGSIPAGNGRFGHADIAGNMWEWSLDGVAVLQNPCTDCGQFDSFQSRVQRGGSWLQEASYLTTSFRGSVQPISRGYTFGIRCGRAP